MKDRVLESIDRHRRFLTFGETDRPIVGFYIGGWEDLSRYSEKSESLFDKGILQPQDVTIDKFRDMYRHYSKNLMYEDDFIRTLDPVPSIPWVESACGCPIKFTGKNFWSQKIGLENAMVGLDQIPVKDNPWILKYTEFVEFLAEEYPDHAIGQSILRGPLDALCALVGDTETIYSFYDDPDFVKTALDKLGDVFNEFIAAQFRHTPRYHGGYGLGQFYMWAPDRISRIQEDAEALITPSQYDEFIYESDVKISSTTPYCLCHTHATAMFIMDKIVKNKNLSIVQVSKDEGDTTLSDLLEGMKTIQKAGMGVLIKGKLDHDDIDLMRKHLDKRGLAIGCVVGSRQEADEMKAYLHGINW